MKAGVLVQTCRLAGTGNTAEPSLYQFPEVLEGVGRIERRCVAGFPSNREIVMISLQEIEEMVSLAMKSAISSERDGEIIPYKNAGGQNGRGWKTVGFYAAKADGSRLVFETLVYPSNEICVVRVYHENSSEFLFARKWSGNKSRFETAMNEAAAAFRTALPASPVADQGASDLDDIPISSEQRERLVSALKPIPPPCSLDTIEKA